MKLDYLYPSWEIVRRSLELAARPLDPELLDLREERGDDSVGDLLRRLLFTENYWTKQVIQGAGVVRESDYGRERFPTAAGILEGLNEVWRWTAAILERTHIDELERVYVTPDGEMMRLMTIFWILFMEELHARGQVFALLRRLGFEPIRE